MPGAQHAQGLDPSQPSWPLPGPFFTFPTIITPVPFKEEEMEGHRSQATSPPHHPVIPMPGHMSGEAGTGTPEAVALAHALPAHIPSPQPKGPEGDSSPITCALHTADIPAPAFQIHEAVLNAFFFSVWHLDISMLLYFALCLLPPPDSLCLLD